MTAARCMLLRAVALILAAALLVCLCSCELAVPDADANPPENATIGIALDNELSLELLIDQLNEQRRKTDEADYELTDFLPEYTSEDFLEDEFTDEEFERLTTQPTFLPAQLELEQALEDVDLLFRLLRTSYGAYTLFGGDKIFDAAEKRMLDRLNIYYSSGITPDDLKTLILTELSFIEDTHFYIGGSGTGFDEMRYYSESSKTEFRADELGIYTLLDSTGERWYVSPEDMQYLKLTIADSGELVYALFGISGMHDQSSLPESITLYTLSGNTAELELQWAMMSCLYESAADTYTLREVDGIPVVTLNSYYLDEDCFDDINAYLNDAERLRGEPVIVVDLRCNTGGYDCLNSMWLYQLTGGDEIDWTVGYAAYISRLNEYVLTNDEESIDALFKQLDFFDRYPDYWEYEDDEEYAEGDVYLTEPESRFYEYDGTIFVLFNKHTYSAGELALFQFENMSNVVFVGMNSNGCLLTGGTNMNAPVWLPNSGLSVYYSILLVTSDIMDGFDAYGYQPDIVAADDEIVEDVINCWYYYNNQEKIS